MELLIPLMAFLVILFLFGIFSLIKYFKNRKKLFLVFGIILILFGGYQIFCSLVMNYKCFSLGSGLCIVENCTDDFTVANKWKEEGYRIEEQLINGTSRWCKIFCTHPKSSCGWYPPLPLCIKVLFFG